VHDLYVTRGSSSLRFIGPLCSCGPGLADENEVVRDAALAAGHVVVKHYATT